jgi:transposase InsO family protein
MPNATQPPRRMRFSFESRCRIVQLVLAGESPEAAAVACGASRATGYRLWRRYRQGGWPALVDRPSRPKRQPRRLPAKVEQEILAWREHLRAGPLVLAAVLERPPSTIGRCCAGSAAHGCRGRSATRPSAMNAPVPASSCTWTRRSWAASGRSASACTAIARSAAVGPAGSTSTSRSMTAPGSPTPSCSRLRTATPVPPSSAAPSPGMPSRASSSSVCSQTTRSPTTRTAGSRSAPSSGSNGRYTRPYSPWTNGKAEALIKTLLREWAYRFVYPTSTHRSRALNGFLRWYNKRRPHGSLGGRPPISRVSHLCGHYS